MLIIGGGIVGCSVAHLAKRGSTDVLLLERKKRLTCGTTWHAAGLVGREALLRQREARVRLRLVAVALEHADRLLYHNEPIWRNGGIVGRPTSGMFDHFLNQSLGLRYVANGGAPLSDEWITAGRYEVEIAAERVPARASLRPFYDPNSERVRG